jgi:hypothetical protein
MGADAILLKTKKSNSENRSGSLVMLPSEACYKYCKICRMIFATLQEYNSSASPGTSKSHEK